MKRRRSEMDAALERELRRQEVFRKAQRRYRIKRGLWTFFWRVVLLAVLCAMFLALIKEHLSNPSLPH